MNYGNHTAEDICSNKVENTIKRANVKWETYPFKLDDLQPAVIICRMKTSTNNVNRCLVCSGVFFLFFLSSLLVVFTHTIDAAAIISNTIKLIAQQCAFAVHGSKACAISTCHVIYENWPQIS